VDSRHAPRPATRRGVPRPGRPRRRTRACFARAHLEAGDIDLIVHAGLYREDNLCEPALAALIQEDIAANPRHPPRRGAHGQMP
jgi:hypothetical protein